MACRYGGFFHTFREQGNWAPLLSKEGQRVVVASWLTGRARVRPQEKDEDGTQEISRAERAKGVSKISRVLVDVPNGQGAEVAAQVAERIH